MPEQFGEKTIDPTPHRLQRAREQGQVAKSQDLASAAVLIGALVLLLYLGGRVVGFLTRYTEGRLGAAQWQEVDEQFARGIAGETAIGLAATVLPILGVLLVLAVASHVSQSGLLYLPQKLAPDLSNVDPIKGAGRIFSFTNVLRLIFGLGKTAIVAVVALLCVWDERYAILALVDRSPAEIGAFILGFALWTSLKIGLVLLVLAIVDYWRQRLKLRRDLMMSIQEFKEELKQTEGDPQTIARRRHIHRQLINGQLAKAVPRATAVVTNPTELAIALKYDLETMEAPVVLAKGAGVLAQRIRRLALENNIPIIERKELAQALYKHVAVNQQIPPEQYAAVAEVLRYVYELKGQKPHRRNLKGSQLVAGG
jgi:flagellar biosynthetic protein FlhB